MSESYTCIECSVLYDDRDGDLDERMCNVCLNTIHEQQELTGKEVSDMIDKLDEKKSPGPNGIPVLLLKKFKDFFSFWLAKLINLSFETGVFPDLLKIAKISPLHKKECKLDFHNYRPISLLSVYSKIFEKLIYCRVYAYLVKYNLI